MAMVDVSILPIKDDGAHDATLYDTMRMAYDELHIEINSKLTEAEVQSTSTSAYEASVTAYKASAGTGTALTESEFKLAAEYATQFNRFGTFGNMDHFWADVSLSGQNDHDWSLHPWSAEQHTKAEAARSGFVPLTVSRLHAPMMLRGSEMTHANHTSDEWMTYFETYQRVYIKQAIEFINSKGDMYRSDAPVYFNDTTRTVYYTGTPWDINTEHESYQRLDRTAAIKKIWDLVDPVRTDHSEIIYDQLIIARRRVIKNIQRRSDNMTAADTAKAIEFATETTDPNTALWTYHTQSQKEYQAYITIVNEYNASPPIARDTSVVKPPISWPTNSGYDYLNAYNQLQTTADNEAYDNGDPATNVAYQVGGSHYDQFMYDGGPSKTISSITGTLTSTAAGIQTAVDQSTFNGNNRDALKLTSLSLPWAKAEAITKAIKGYPVNISAHPKFDQKLWDAIQPAADAFKAAMEAATTIPELEALTNGNDAIANPEAAAYFDAIDAFDEELLLKKDDTVTIQNDLTEQKITVTSPGVTSSNELWILLGSIGAGLALVGGGLFALFKRKQKLG